MQATSRENETTTTNKFSIFKLPLDNLILGKRNDERTYTVTKVLQFFPNIIVRACAVVINIFASVGCAAAWLLHAVSVKMHSLIRSPEQRRHASDDFSKRWESFYAEKSNFAEMLMTICTDPRVTYTAPVYVVSTDMLATQTNEKYGSGAVLGDPSEQDKSLSSTGVLGLS